MNIVQYVRQLATLLETEDKDRWIAIVRVLGRRTIYLEIDGDSMTLRVHNGQLKVSTGKQRPIDCVIEIKKITMFALVDSRTTLLESLFEGNIFVQADTVNLLVTSEIASYIMEAGMRCQSIQRLWDNFRLEFE